MTHNQYKYPHMIVKELNETPLSKNVEKLLRQEGVEIWQGKLLILHLLEWALENLAADYHWSQAVDQAVNLAAVSEPEAVYQNLTSPVQETATTLRQAGQDLLQECLELIPPGSSPA